MSTVETKSEVFHHVMQAGLLEAGADPYLTADEIPAWLNDSFIENILRKHYQDEALTVKNLKIRQCGGKGDSYASLMYRVGTFFCTGKDAESVKFLSLVVKTLPENEMAIEKLGNGNYNVQNKEMEMYARMIPEFRRLLESIGEDADIFPAVLAVEKSLDVIVLEDLTEKKFVMADRYIGLDLDHILMALRKLARMHAVSVMIHQKDPQAFENLDTGFFTRKTDAFHVMFESLCEALIEEVKTWEGFEYYAKKLTGVRKNLVVNAQRAFDCDDGDFHVLCHGDLWTNNLMYKYDEAGRPIDSVLLDFQFVSFGSPALDLIVSLNREKFNNGNRKFRNVNVISKIILSMKADQKIQFKEI